MNRDVQMIIDHELETLKQLPPLAGLPESLLALVLQDSRLVFYPRGAHLAHPDLGSDLSTLFIVKQGRIALHMPDSQENAHLGAPEAELGPGSLFGSEWALGQRPPAYIYLAADDAFCWQLGRKAQEALQQSPQLWRWLLEESWRGLEQLRERQARDREARYLAEQVLCLPLGSLLRRSPLSVAPEQSCAAVQALMAEEKTGSVVVVEQGRPVGIITETDLVRRSLALGGAQDLTAAGIMSPRPVTLNATHTLAEAALEMTSRGIRHVPVVDDEGLLLGVVSERDIFMRQRAGFGTLAAPIEQAESVAALAPIVATIRESGRGMYLQGMGAVQLTNLISSLNDRVAERILALVEAAHELPGSYCWLAFGSEGRMEQTFSTDQDNGLIFVPSSAEQQEAERQQYLAFADQVNQSLDQVGFPLCKGNIMARNPEWCLTLEEWQQRFSRWVRSPTPEALLNASIFFDFRPLHGDASLAEALRDHLFGLSQENSIFLHMMAKNALTAIPPLGKFSRFNTEKARQNTVDLKTMGVRLFVDIARIYALRHGVRATNTIQRLRLGGQKLKRNAKLIEADIAAFEFIQAIRMGGQLLAKTGEDPNRIDPYSLNELDQRVLQESFRQAQLLQERLRLDYRA